jgi:hypothetical protein
MEAHRDAPNLRLVEHPAVQRGTAMLTVCAHLQKGEAVIAVLALQARVAGLRTGLQTADEGGTRLIQTIEHVLHDLRVDVVVFGPHRLDGRQLCRLHDNAHRDAAPLPRRCALLQASVVAFAAAPHDRLQRPFLLGRWQQLVCEGLAHTVALLFHTQRFCLLGKKPARIGTVVALASGRATRLAPPAFRQGHSPGFFDRAGTKLRPTRRP